MLPGKRDSVGLGGSDCPKLYSRSVYLPLEYSTGYQTKGGALLLVTESTKTCEVNQVIPGLKNDDKNARNRRWAHITVRLLIDRGVGCVGAVSRLLIDRALDASEFICSALYCMIMSHKFRNLSLDLRTSVLPSKIRRQ